MTLSSAGQPDSQEGTAAPVDAYESVLRPLHLEGIRMTREARDPGSQPDPDFDSLPQGQVLPEVSREQLTPGLLRAAILRHGSLLVRGLVDRGVAERLAGQIDAAFEERADDEASGRELYAEFLPEHPYPIMQRAWVAQTNAMWLGDAPPVMLKTMDLFREAGLGHLFEAYLGEQPVFSLQKSTLRKALPETEGAWHQDGAFMGDVRAINVWLSLSRCGDVAPGLDVVPRRLEEIVPTGTEGALFDWAVSPAVAEQTAAGLPIQRPIFEPGDALLFDDLCLHNTATDPAMANTRYAIESWFFGPSSFAEDYAPFVF